MSGPATARYAQRHTGGKSRCLASGQPADPSGERVLAGSVVAAHTTSCFNLGGSRARGAYVYYEESAIAAAALAAGHVPLPNEPRRQLPPLVCLRARRALRVLNGWCSA